MKILVANVGSTSFKFKLFDMTTEHILSSGKIENIGSETSSYSFFGRNESTGNFEQLTYPRAVELVIEFVTNQTSGVISSLSELAAIGFKTVHAKGIRECRVLDKAVLNAMEEYSFLAPAHNPPYIKAINIFATIVPSIPLVGLFEPAFHKNIPDFAYIYGIPYEWYERHQIRKYGFHGASHRWVSEHAPELAGMTKKNLKVISCHLGGSSSICAISDGVSVDTSMGFSPQSGVLNAKRCGDLDPFISLYLQEKEGLTPTQISEILNTASGLTGISGIGGDMKKIINAARAGNDRARLAIDAFCYGVKKYIGSYFVALEGLDILAFTGGIGERSHIVRENICRGLECIGVKLDTIKNKETVNDAIISDPGSKVKVLVINANEELVVAREVAQLLAK